MSARFGSAHKSYAKTTAACLVIALLALVLAGIGLLWLPRILGLTVAALSLLVLVGGAVLACARAIVGAVLLVGTVCDGLSHGGCDAACHTIWKSAWLRRVEPSENTAGGAVSSERSDLLTSVAALQAGTRGPAYTCQLKQLHAASRPIGKCSATNSLRPLISGNVAPAAFAVGWLTHMFNGLQRLRQGVGFPAFEAAARDRGIPSEISLQVGDQVVVRGSAEIRATLNDRLLHRGLWFDTDMLKHCGRRYCAQAEIKRLIDIVTGEMRAIKTLAHTLHDVHFSGERQFFNAQYEPLYGRAAWLRVEETGTGVSVDVRVPGEQGASKVTATD